MGDAAAYGFVLVNMLGQPPAFQATFLESVRDAATRHELPEDAVAFAEARFRQTEIENRYKTHLPANPELRDQISRLYRDDQAVREREGFDAKKMLEADRRTAGPLKTIFDRYGVPTYDMVGVQAAKDFVVMVAPAAAVSSHRLPKLKANVDVGQATLPKDMADRLRLEAGDRVLAVETERGILLTPYDPETERASRVAAKAAKKYRNALRELAK